MTEPPPHLARGRPAESGDLLLERRTRLAAPHLPGGDGVLLDFGCGNGAQTLALAPRFRQTVGVDVEREHLRALARAVAGVAPGRVTPVLFGGGRLPFRDRAFDAAVSFEVLEHVPDDRAALAELRRVLRPGGVLVLTVPNRWWPFETHGADLPLLRRGRVPLLSWLPRRLHDRWARARIYRRREICALVGEAGFRVEEALYVTAPMDVVRPAALQRLLRRTVFAGDRTPVPWLATAVMVAARG